MAQRGNQEQVEQEELKKKFQDLENTLAEKEQQLSRALQKMNTRTIMHVETLAELSSMENALNESEVKRAALEESIQKLQEKDDDHKKKLKEKEESMKKMMEQENDRELEKMQKMFEEQLQKKEESMRQELCQQEKNLQDELKEVTQKYEEKVVEKEVWMRQQLLEKEDSFKKLLDDICQPFEGKAQQWALNIKELEDQLQESNKIRLEKEEKTNLEIQKMSAELSNLQVRCIKHCPCFKRFQGIFSQI